MTEPLVHRKTACPAGAAYADSGEVPLGFASAESAVDFGGSDEGDLSDLDEPALAIGLALVAGGAACLGSNCGCTSKVTTCHGRLCQTVESGGFSSGVVRNGHGAARCVGQPLGCKVGK